MSEIAGRITAATAHALATDAKSEIDKHEAVCAERYVQIAKDMTTMSGSISKIERNIGWAVNTGVLTFIGLIGWIGVQFFQATMTDTKASRATMADQAQQITFLKNQVTNLTAKMSSGQSVVVAAPPSAVTTTTNGSPVSAVDATPS